MDALVLQRRPQRALPCHRLFLQHGGEQIELLVEQLLVLLQVEAEQRKRLGEGAAPEDDLGAPVRDRVDGGEALKHADRIVGRQHRHGRAEPDALGAACDRGQHDFRRGDREVRAVVLADADGIDADLVGENRLLDEIADDLRGVQRLAVRSVGDVAEGVEAEFEGLIHSAFLSAQRNLRHGW